MSASSSLQFVVGNTYQRIPELHAKYDKSRRHRKIHDWTLYVDVVQGSPDALEKVTFDLGSSFDPSQFICAAPIPIPGPNGGSSTRVWRFATRQQSYGPVSATVLLKGRGGSVDRVEHTIVLDTRQVRRRNPVLHTFVEAKPLRPFPFCRLDPLQNFGIELELTSANHLSTEEVARGLSNSQTTVQVMDSYASGRHTSRDWKLVPDSSIICNRNLPDCNTFELVSPILRGGNGLSQVSQMLHAAQDLEPSLKVNRSMGFHVHIDVSSLSLSQLIKICQNFIKYEEVMDKFMPSSRRNNSPESEQYFKSNSASVPGSTNKQKHASLAACTDVNSLAHLMNRGQDRYYKLNLQNLAQGRQPTLEFRQHSATFQYAKVGAWIRFCVAFVRQSARLAPPTPFAEHRKLEDKTKALFCYVVKDRALRNYFLQRRKDLQERHDEGDSDCGCAAGGFSCGQSHCIGIK